MTLEARSQLGPYEATGTLGARGVGKVYRARHTRLKRDVALKIFPEAFSSDPERPAPEGLPVTMQNTLRNGNVLMSAFDPLR